MVDENLDPTITYVIDPVSAVELAEYIGMRNITIGDASRITSATNKNEMTLFIGAQLAKMNIDPICLRSTKFPSNVDDCIDM